MAETDQEQATHGSGGEERGSARADGLADPASALGIALVLIGVVLNWVVFGIGIGVAAIAAMPMDLRVDAAPAPLRGAGNARCGGTGRR